MQNTQMERRERNTQLDRRVQYNQLDSRPSESGLSRLIEGPAAWLTSFLLIPGLIAVVFVVATD